VSDAPRNPGEETFARQLLGLEQPIGKRLRFGHLPTGDAIEIVGVVEDGKYQSLGEAETPAVYSPMAQQYSGWTTPVARSSLPPEQTGASGSHGNP